jgi:RNA polymerase sigma-70 factor (sigma-E family)
MKPDPGAEFSDYMSARMPSLRRLALLLCQDWHQADDLLQTAMTKTFVFWARASAADSTDAYVRAILVREFLHERRTGWARRVSLTDRPIETAVASADPDGALDLWAAVGALPRRQRAVLVLRYYCDLNVEQSAQVLGCTPSTIKSQTAKALATLRRIMGADSAMGASSAMDARTAMGASSATGAASGTGAASAMGGASGTGAASGTAAGRHGTPSSPGEHREVADNA